MLRKIAKGVRILWRRLTQQGLRPTVLWAADHAVRVFSGAPIRSLSQITPQLHVGGQYRRHGWPRLVSRGVVAVVNLRVELDDNDYGIAPPRYLYLPTADDNAPTLEQLHVGVAFIVEEIARGSGVYVHCGSGIGRAAAMVAAYLVSTGMTPAQAWACIREVRPFINPTPVQVAQVERFAARQRVQRREHLCDRQPLRSSRRQGRSG
ncbi:MAG: dual specificity protein phosphatase family protein [Chloroflexota bacterium]|nr:dual specificity protein phosphatase family protein [Chloroflexota bacterium]